MTREEIYNVPKYAGIYCLKNTANGKCYIGQAVKLRKRITEHWNHSKSDRYPNIVLYKAIKKYGWEVFELIILDTFRDALNGRTKYNLDILEKKYIQEYDSYNNGYNSTLGDDAGVLGLKHTEESLAKISAATRARLDKKVEDLSTWMKAKNLETGEIFEASNSTELSKLINIPSYSIKKCCSGKIKISHKKWVCAYYNDEFREVPEFGSDKYDELIRTQFRELSTKEEILEYIKANPRCTYGEVKQNYDLCKKTFYNYRKELGLDSQQRCDYKAPKEEFIEYSKTHDKLECLEHFGICERTYYKLRKKYEL